jgi:serine/threonine-protein kinase RsbW
MQDLYRVRLPATAAAVRLARHGVIDAFAQAGISDAALLADVALAVSEATTNVVRHAYPPDGDVGYFDVIVTRTPENLIVTVKDEGAGMRAHPLTHGLGVGLQVMNSQAERLEIESDSTGTIVTLYFTAPGRR